MIQLTKETIELLENGYKGTKIRSDKVLYKNPADKIDVTIPSKLYPLSDKKRVQLFSALNTEYIENDPEVKKVFDELEFPVGRCYSNTENLYDALTAKGITELETYVGWVMFGGRPIHHCWLIYKGKHLLDGGLTVLDLNVGKIFSEQNITDPTEQRAMYRDLFIEESKKPNSETCTFGQVIPIYLYVGTKCVPNDGRIIYNKLIDEYPNHPSYAGQNQDPRGASKLQKDIMKKMNGNKK